MQNQSQNPFSKIDDQFEEIKNLISNLSKVQPEKEPENDLINLNGACRILNLAPGTIYNKKKEIPHFKRGKLLFFSKAALINYIKEGKQLTPSEIKKEANLTLCKQKIIKKDSRYSQKERVKKYLDTTDIEKETNEEAAEDAGKIDYSTNEDQLENPSK